MRKLYWLLVLVTAVAAHECVPLGNGRERCWSGHVEWTQTVVSWVTNPHLKPGADQCRWLRHLTLSEQLDHEAFIADTQTAAAELGEIMAEVGITTSQILDGVRGEKMRLAAIRVALARMTEVARMQLLSHSLAMNSSTPKCVSLGDGVSICSSGADAWTQIEEPMPINDKCRWSPKQKTFLHAKCKWPHIIPFYAYACYAQIDREDRQDDLDYYRYTMDRMAEVADVQQWHRQVTESTAELEPISITCLSSDVGQSRTFSTPHGSVITSCLPHEIVYHKSLQQPVPPVVHNLTCFRFSDFECTQTAIDAATCRAPDPPDDTNQQCLIALFPHPMDTLFDASMRRNIEQLRRKESEQLGLFDASLRRYLEQPRRAESDQRQHAEQGQNWWFESSPQGRNITRELEALHLTIEQWRQAAEAQHAERIKQQQQETLAALFWLLTPVTLMTMMYVVSSRCFCQ